ncbi:MAG: primosomal protein N' [Candidatus Ozemobacteraceae bacterium]
MIFVDVSFPLAIPRPTLTYHYNPPVTTEDAPSPSDPIIGSRVVAPLNGRPLLGYISAVRESDPGFPTKAILEILDPIPLLSPPLVELGRWIASSCLCSPGEAFHAMLPGGIKGRITRVIRPTPEAVAKNKQAEPLPQAVVWLCGNGPTSLTAFTVAFPQEFRKLRAWSDEGLVTLEYRREGEAGPKLQRVFTLAQDRPLDLPALTAKERVVIEYLLKTNIHGTLAQICRGAGVSSSPVNGLLAKGLLTAQEERIERETATDAYYQTLAPPSPPPLTDDQKRCLEGIRMTAASDRRPVLVRGVTCSGKTEVYLRWAAEQLEIGLGVIVLVPEISLTPQMVKRFRDRFGMKVAILHSKLGDGERFDQWEGIRRGRFPLVVGARSGVFAPVPRLGSIILDEEGEPSFKQGEAPRYHARDVAQRRCELEGALLIMGSATPTLEAYQLARDEAYHLIEMPTRVTDRKPPTVELVDMRQELNTKKNRSMFSGALSNALRETLATGKQAILYLNKRGHSSFVLCRSCGETIECSRCQVSLVYHSGCRILRCHYCGEARPIPTTCPTCSSEAIRFFGAGTQRVEAEARRYFPRARIERLDSDSITAKGSLEAILDRFGKGEIDILVGTQMVAKGLDFPNVTLVGILAADALLRLPDYRASERNFSLLAQVSGRAGRGDTPGHVVLQTYFPEHHSIRYALTEDYTGFFSEELAHRRAANFPPFCHLGSFLLSSSKPEDARAAGERLAAALNARPLFAAAGPGSILGPAPAPIERINNVYRFQLLAKGRELVPLTNAIREALAEIKIGGDLRITVDMDPFFSL